MNHAIQPEQVLLELFDKASRAVRVQWTGNKPKPDYTLNGSGYTLEVVTINTAF